MSVERKVGGSPIPFSRGKRFGMDLNMSNSVIVIDGVFVDDTVSAAAVDATSAVGEIDFGIKSHDILSQNIPDVAGLTGTGTNGFSPPCVYQLRNKENNIDEPEEAYFERNETSIFPLIPSIGIRIKL